MADWTRGLATGAAALFGGREAPAGAWALRIAGAVGLAAAATAGNGYAPPSKAEVEATPPAAAAAPQRTIWLEQGWNDQQRRKFHHESQGTATFPIPFTWFMALERPTVIPSGMFRDGAYLDRFGFIPSPRDAAANPYGLPVGFARTLAEDPRTGQPLDSIGFTCAACHTARLDYGGTSILVDGGPALTDLGKLRKALGFALGMTLVPTRFNRFADRVLGPDHRPAEKRQLRQALEAVVKEGFGQQLQAQKLKGSVEEGFGRLDALNRIGNEVFGDQLGISQNNVALTAPVAYPHIWDTGWFDWVQYNGSIEQPMVRNAGEAMGVSAVVNFNGTKTPRFTSTVPVDKLHDAIEEVLAGKDQPLPARKWSGLRSPVWPETILPAIDTTLAKQGEALYRSKCQGCHLPDPKSDTFWDSAHWTDANEYGQRYLKLKLIPIETVGTDEAQAADMKARRVRVPASFRLERQVGSADGLPVYGYGDALGQVVELVVNRWYDSRTPPTPEPDRARMNGYRKNGIRDPLAYKARPLNGIWATAPYLHNGSVPTLYDLLSPYDERPKSFWLGNRVFDPVKVGYRTGKIEGGFELVAARKVNGRYQPVRGNGNGGHLFETPPSPAQRRAGTIGDYLKPEERRALVEYLKTL